MKGQPRITESDYNVTIPDMVKKGMPAGLIAMRFGVTIGSLRALCAKRGVSLSRKSNKERHWIIPLPDVVKDEIRRKATHMGKTETQLVRELLEAIALDDLYEAVLDDHKAMVTLT